MPSDRFVLPMAMLLLTSLANTAPRTSTWWRITFDPAPKPWSKSAPQKMLDIKVTNVTDHVAWVAESNPVNDYQVAIADSSGRFVPMTAAGLTRQRDLRYTLFRTTVETVMPGGSRTSEIDLAEFYDLSPGKYTVKATLRAITEDAIDEKTNHRKPNAPPEPSGSTTIEITP